MARKSKATDVRREAMVLLYHPVTGFVVYAHHAAASAAEVPGRQALERQAVEHAKRLGAARKGIAVEKLRRLHVHPRAFRPGRAYRVDVRKRSLVTVGRAPARPGGAARLQVGLPGRRAETAAGRGEPATVAAGSQRMMKVFVVCDNRGDVTSVGIPNPAWAGSLRLEAPADGRVHVLDVDSRAMSRDDVLHPRSEAVRRKVYERLRAMIARARSPRRG